jgi:hypothetical protein
MFLQKNKEVGNLPSPYHANYENKENSYDCNGPTVLLISLFLQKSHQFDLSAREGHKSFYLNFTVSYSALNTHCI